MRRRPQSWHERFDESLHKHPSPALEDWRWAKDGQGPADARAVSAAWDLVTLQASAEAAMLNSLLAELDSDAQRTMLPALIVAAARWTEVGTLCVFGADQRQYWPRDLAFVVGREHLPPRMTIHSRVEEGRNVIDFLLSYTHVEHALGEGDDLLDVYEATRTMAILLDDGERTPRAAAEQRSADVELQQRDHLLVRYHRSDLWGDVVGCANEAIRTLVQSTRFDVEQAMSSES